jgi:hypothetical protein
LRADSEGRARFIFDEMDKRIPRSERSGIGRLVAITRALGIPVEVDDGIRRDVHELAHRRNAVLHRGGRADERFVAECPWVEVEVGDVVDLPYDRFMELVTSAIEYMTSVVNGLNRVLR